MVQANKKNPLAHGAMGMGMGISLQLKGTSQQQKAKGPVGKHRSTQNVFQPSVHGIGAQKIQITKRGSNMDCVPELTSNQVASVRDSAIVRPNAALDTPSSRKATYPRRPLAKQVDSFSGAAVANSIASRVNHGSAKKSLQDQSVEIL